MNSRVGSTECFERPVNRVRNVTNVKGYLVEPSEILALMAADYCDLVSTSQQLWNKVTAQEACPSGNKHVHQASGRAIFVGRFKIATAGI
jgi:hypothetical protein